MSSIVSALSDLISSLVELVWSFFTTAGHLVENTAKFTAKFATEIVQLVVNFFKGLVDLAGGLVSFVVGESNVDTKPTMWLIILQAMSSCLVFLLLSSSASCNISATKVARSRLATRSSTKHHIPYANALHK